MWIALACGSAVFAGLTAILAKCGIRRVDSNLATALRTVVVLAFAWLMVYVTGVQQGLATLDAQSVIMLALSGLATGASWLCYFRALQLGDVSRVTPIDKSSTVLTILLAALLLGETISAPNALGIVLIGVGTLLMIGRPAARAAQASGDACSQSPGVATLSDSSASGAAASSVAAAELPLSGNSASGAAASGVAAAELPLSDSSASGAAASGVVAAGLPLSGNSASCAAASGVAAAELPLSGNSASGAAASGDAATGMTASGAMPTDVQAAHPGRWLIYALLSAVFASAQAILAKVGISGVDSTLGTALRTVVVLVMAWVMVFLTGGQRQLRSIDARSWVFLALSGVATGASWLCYYAALQQGPAGAVVAIDKLSILLTIAFARLVLGERLSRRAALGLVMVTAGTLAMLL